MIRFICKEVDYAAAGAVGAEPEVSWQTFDCNGECATLEAWLREKPKHGYGRARTVVGFELLDPTP